MTTLRFKAGFKKKATDRQRAAIATARRREWKPGGKRRQEGASRTARLLAVAHFLDRGLADGSIPGFAHAVELLGVSRSRTSQILRLLDLKPEMQEAIMLRTSEVTEGSLRGVGESDLWERQHPF